MLFFGRFGVPFWGHFGAMLVSFFDVYCFSFGFSIILRVYGVLFSSYFGSFFASFFASIFGWIFDRFWCQKGGLHTHPRAHRHTLFSIDFSLFGVCLCAPVCVCVCVRLCVSKSGPRAAKSGPRAAKSDPKAAKSGSRAARRGPGAAKSNQIRWFSVILL